MTTRMNRKQLRRNKPKRKRKLLVMIVMMFSIFFIVTAAYAMVQFDAGRKNSEKNLASNGDEVDNSIGNEVEVKEPENNEPINVLLIGIDTAENEPARTDTIMIAQYDAKNGTARLASIMRDTYVEIPGRSDNKINAAFAFGGPELLRTTIEKNFDLDINYYAMVNFDSFKEVVNTVAPDGLEVDVQKRMYYQDIAGATTIDFQPGLQKLDGQEALNYVRFRHDSQNDFGRVQRQQEILQLIKDELFSFSGLTRIPRLIGAVEPHLDTNIRTTKMISLGKDFVLNPVTEIEMLRIPIDGGYHDDDRANAGRVLVIDLEKNTQAIQSFFNDEPPVVADKDLDKENEETEL